jgi:transposase
MRFIVLTNLEREQLEKIHITSTNFIERSRCFQILLSDRKNSMAEVSRITKVDLQAVIRLFNAWDSASAENKMNTLSIASGRGPKVKLEQVRDKLPEMVEKHSRNLNPILHWLDIEYNIKICKQTLRTFLKDARL